MPRAHYSFFSLLLFISNISLTFGQNVSPSLSLETFAKKAPLFISKSPEKLAKYLTKSDSTENQKVFHIYTWITHNIKYDLKALSKLKTKHYEPKQTLKRRKGICYQYSSLFNLLCQYAGVSSKEIYGYSRGSSYFEEDIFFETDHSWNGVKIDSSWFLVDATWGSGFLVQKKQRFKKLMSKWFSSPYINNKYKFVQKANYQYFKTDPKILIQQHLPADPSWQLVKYPISIQTFEKKNWKIYQNKMDSICYKAIDSLEYLAAINKYEFLSTNQYLDITASNANLFNSKNFKLLSQSSYNNSAVHQVRSNNYESLKSKNNKSIQNYKTTITLAKKHIRNINVQSKIILQKTTRKINTELSYSSKLRSKLTKHQLLRINKVLIKKDRNLTKYKAKIESLQNIITGYKVKTLSLTRFSKIPKPKLVEQNNNNVIKAFHNITFSEDSVKIFSKKLIHLIKKKSPLYSIHNSLNNSLSLQIFENSRLINDNQRFSLLRSSMKKIIMTGAQVDSLNTTLKAINDSISLVNRKLKSLTSLIISQSRLTQKMLFDNCRYSNGLSCDRDAYFEYSNSIYESYKSRLDIQKINYDLFINDNKYYQGTYSLLSDQIKEQQKNLEYIEFYKEWRTSGILFNKLKSTYEVNEIIHNSKQRIVSLYAINRKISAEIMAYKKN